MQVEGLTELRPEMPEMVDGRYRYVNWIGLEGREVWGNNLYTVFIQRNVCMEGDEQPSQVHEIHVRRNDGGKIKSIKHMEWIKAMLFGTLRSCVPYPDTGEDAPHHFFMRVFDGNETPSEDVKNMEESQCVI